MQHGRSSCHLAGKLFQQPSVCRPGEDAAGRVAAQTNTASNWRCLGSGEVDASEGRATLQEDLDRLEESANKNFMKFNKDTCKVLHLGNHNPGGQHRLGSTQLGSSSVERDLGVLVDSKLNMNSAAVAKKVNRMLGCINKGITSRDKEVSTPLYSVLEYFWSPLDKNNVARLERVQRRATKMIKGLGSLLNEERLRELCLFSLEKRRLRGDLITMFQYLKGGYKEDGESLFTRSHMEKMKGKGYKLLLGRFRLDTRGKFFTMRTISHWNNHRITESYRLEKTFKIIESNHKPNTAKTTTTPCL
ncbi:hypothetical protein QYF61_009024 [Mycteria americana]|uniref:Uncharacterized protein n=1 Tax=Mycteria americana TaxID=33587 RepID=A0AAN7NQ26_MYCAM|nr:hypothetical protein QYF61_009024 [Mycteria americana]